MRLDSVRLRQDFKFDDVPRMYCSDCEDGRVLLHEKDAELTFDKATAEAEEYLSPEDYEAHGSFHCGYSCSDCKTRGTMIGEVFQSHTPISSSTFTFDLETHRRYSPRAMYPAPMLFVPEGKIPDPIQESLERVFFHFWTDPTACVGRCRITIELLLDDKGVPRTTKSGAHLKLHPRIELYRGKYADIADLMMAAKWLGNDASHTQALTRSDAVDALELLAAVLDALYNRGPDAVRELAARINANKSAVSRATPTP